MPDPVSPPTPVASLFQMSAADERSLPEVHGSVPVPETRGFWRNMLAFAGPGYLVAVGYMDPGNWATDIAGRRPVRLHAAQRRHDLEPDGDPAAGPGGPAGHRQRTRPGAGLPRQLLPARHHRALAPRELAIAACDLAEVLGAAIALNLLFGLPLLLGVIITAFDVLIVLYLQQHRFRYVEVLVVLLIVGIAAAFAVELWLSKPVVARAYWPGSSRRR